MSPFPNNPEWHSRVATILNAAIHSPDTGLGVLSEEFVKNAVVQWLNEEDYAIKRLRTLSQHGPDVVAKKRRSNNYFIVEVKGEPPTNPNKMRYPTFLSGLGEIFQRVKHERHYRYALAVPQTFENLIVRHVPWAAAKKLGLEFLIVDAESNVRRLTWSDLPRL